MPASSAMRASRRLSGQLPDQRPGTLVTARPDEQLDPNSPICRTLLLCIALRERIDVPGACTAFTSLRRRHVERGADAGGDLGRSLGQLADQGLNLLAGHRIDIELEL